MNCLRNTTHALSTSVHDIILIVCFVFEVLNFGIQSTEWFDYFRISIQVLCSFARR